MGHLQKYSFLFHRPVRKLKRTMIGIYKYQAIFVNLEIILLSYRKQSWNTNQRGEEYWHHCTIMDVCLQAQLCLTLRHPVDCSPPGSSVHGILQARILGWVAIAFSRASFQPQTSNPGLLCLLHSLALLWPSSMDRGDGLGGKGGRVQWGQCKWGEAQRD